MIKTRVAVLRGGPSSEYEISMRNGLAVIEALLRIGFDVEDIIVNRDGEWIKNGFVKQPGEALLATDVVFIALHGAYGEDGSVQRVLDRLNIPYTGSKAYQSAVAMNKALTKEQLRELGITMPGHLRVTNQNNDLNKVVASIEALFGPNYIVKPINGGSAIGTRTANGSLELLKVLTAILREYDEVLVEERIMGKEATVGVLENFRDQPFYTLPAVEIIPPRSIGFFSYDSRLENSSQQICPGCFAEMEKKRLEELALQVHKALGLSQYSRSDFIVTNNDIYFLEVNTLPGLGHDSLIPKALSDVGGNYDDLIRHLVMDTLSRY